jgi:hypothetical protein
MLLRLKIIETLSNETIRPTRAQMSTPHHDLPRADSYPALSEPTERETFRYRCRKRFSNRFADKPISGSHAGFDRLSPPRDGLGGTFTPVPTRSSVPRPAACLAHKPTADRFPLRAPRSFPGAQKDASDLDPTRLADAPKESSSESPPIADASSPPPRRPQSSLDRGKVTRRRLTRVSTPPPPPPPPPSLMGLSHGERP